MKRAIKFRGKRLGDGKWIYGDFIRNRGLSFIAADEIVDNPLASWQGYNVDANTVGQFTGLYDSNCKEIYESDIVQGLEYADFLFSKDGNVNAVVRWSNKDAGFVFDADLTICVALSELISANVQVIGNVYDKQGK